MWRGRKEGRELVFNNQSTTTVTSGQKLRKKVTLQERVA